MKLLEEYYPATNQHEETRYSCLYWLNEAYNEIYAWGDGSAERLAEAVRRHLLLFQELAAEELGKGGQWLSWRWFPKMHLLLHMCDQCRTWGCPRDSWCYADEGAIGMSVKIAESVHIMTFTQAVMTKYLIWLLLDEICFEV